MKKMPATKRIWRKGGSGGGRERGREGWRGEREREREREYRERERGGGGRERERARERERERWMIICWHESWYSFSHFLLLTVLCRISESLLV